jgi:hypothetical protein
MGIIDVYGKIDINVVHKPRGKNAQFLMQGKVVDIVLTLTGILKHPRDEKEKYLEPLFRCGISSYC